MDKNVPLFWCCLNVILFSIFNRICLGQSTKRINTVPIVVADVNKTKKRICEKNWFVTHKKFSLEKPYFKPVQDKIKSKTYPSILTKVMKSTSIYPSVYKVSRDGGPSQ